MDYLLPIQLSTSGLSAVNLFFWRRGCLPWHFTTPRRKITRIKIKRNEKREKKNAAKHTHTHTHTHTRTISLVSRSNKPVAHETKAQGPNDNEDDDHDYDDEDEQWPSKSAEKCGRTASKKRNRDPERAQPVTKQKSGPNPARIGQSRRKNQPKPSLKKKTSKSS